MTTQCSFIKVNGIQCKIQTRNTICHKHINLYTLQQEKHEQEEEQKRINLELAQLKAYEKNVKAEIKQLLEKKNKISSLKDQLDDAIKDIRILEKNNSELEIDNDILVLERTKMINVNLEIKNRNNFLEQENTDLKKISKSYNFVCQFEKMKIDLRNLTNSKFFDIDAIADNINLQTRIKEIFNCNGPELKKRYWYLQKKRVEFCHPYENTQSQFQRT